VSGLIIEINFCLVVGLKSSNCSSNPEIIFLSVIPVDDGQALLLTTSLGTKSRLNYFLALVTLPDASIEQ
jgi:hypothetical protein